MLLRDQSRSIPRSRSPSVGLGLISPIGIEKALVRFIERLFEHERFDNESIETEGFERVIGLDGKHAPQVWAGSIPWTITGEPNPDDIPVYPSIIVATEKVTVD